MGSAGLAPSCAVAAATAGAAGAGGAGVSVACWGGCSGGMAAAAGAGARAGVGSAGAAPGGACTGWPSVRIITTPEAATSGPTSAWEWVSPAVCAC